MVVSPVIDAHTHAAGLLPRPIRAALHRIKPHHPPECSFADLRAAGVDAVVAKAVGDGVVTRWQWPTSPWRAVLEQFDGIVAEASAAGCRVSRAGDDLTVDPQEPSIILGLEGGDLLGHDPSRVAELAQRGVRVVGIVHMVDNLLGTVCLPWQGYLPVRLPVGRRRTPGLTPIGKEVIAELEANGIVVDLAHADPATTMATCEAATRPVINSHTGAHALQDFARFITDDEARAIAATGGAIGLWPYRDSGRGMVDLDDFARHAAHLAETVGVEHLCIGTDMNGVTGLLDGYDGERDFPKLTGALTHAGFDEAEVAAISGANMRRILA